MDTDRSIASPGLSRRAWLTLVAAAAGAGGAFYLRLGRDELHAWEQEAVERLSRHLALGDELDTLGPAAIEAIGEDRPGELAARLFRTADRFRGRDAEGALELLQDAMRRDYASGRTLPVGHWELSQTEARLFAVLYTTHRSELSRTTTRTGASRGPEPATARRARF
ncbi:MAG: hypothetical protein GEU99_06795 [Luteitalea sp.]|nr:hypothetical protein [Luteitalea sp.]